MSTPLRERVLKSMSPELRDIRIACEQSLYQFACVTFPDRYYSDMHKEFFNFLQSEEGAPYRAGLIPRDHQKALRLDQKVLTPSGWVPTGDLKVGDAIMSPSTANVQYVTELHPVSEMELYEVSFDDGRVVVCNGEHLWNLECPSNWGKSNIKTVSINSILDKYKAQRYDKRTGSYFKESRFFLHPTKALQFEEKSLPIDPYVLGFWIGDGDSARGHITTADTELLQYFDYVDVPSRKYGYRVVGLTKKLRDLGVQNNKHIPKEYLFGSIAQREALLQGLMDSDGFAHEKNKNLSYSTIKEEIKDGVVDLVRSLGGKAKVHSAYTKAQNSDRLVHSYTINIWLPEEITPFRLERKQVRVKPMRVKSALVDINKVNPAKARCITVSEPDGLFITEDYTVTHNSHCMVVYCAWRLCVNPEWTFVYVSANPELAGDQLNSIRNVLTGTAVRELFPELIAYTKDNRTGELKRKPKYRDTNELFSVDHPVREERGLRDPSIRATSVKSSKTGFHCKEVVFDDLVTDENFESEADRREVLKTYKNLMKIATTDSMCKAVGTRYSDKDLYAEMIKSVYEDWDEVNEDGEPTIKPMWEFFERVIEDSPRRTGEGTFIFPKKVMPDGSVFGFDRTEWSKKKASLSVGGESASFYAQYYNDPNDSTNEKFDRSEFQYWDAKHLEYKDGKWWYSGRKLQLCAAADLAWTDKGNKNARRADYTACAVVGFCTEGYTYILDHIRFKTDKPDVYYDKIKVLHERWLFRDLYVETNSAGKFIKMALEDEVRKEGRNIIVHGKTHAGGGTASKEERIAQVLFHRYKNKNVFHYRGGLIGEYEDELVLSRPPHDDLKDCTANAVSNCKKPVQAQLPRRNQNVVQLSRFGGRRRA